jgi:mutator protein MutT
MSGSKAVDVAIAIVVDRGLILICRRKATNPFGGYWEFPGGKCEPGETPAGCVARECLEELEIRVRPTRALPSIEHEYPGKRVTLHPFVCQLESGTPRAISADEFRWAPVASLRQYTFPAANAELIESLVAEGAIDLPAGGA